MKLHLRRNILLFALTSFVIILSINYIILLKVNSVFFKKLDFKSPNFTDSYKPMQISKNEISFDLYHIPHVSSQTAILYIPSNSGILNNVLNSIIPKYSLFAINYPKEKKFQTFENLTQITNLAIREMVSMGVRPENIIIFGQGIGGNIALKVSEKTIFKSILVLNVLQNEKKYCNNRFYPFLCLLVKNTILAQNYSPNLIYYFFNENSSVQAEENYEMFNLINAQEKFFFEISGNDINFNFNQIIEFYNNENLTQNQNFEINQILETQDGEVIENDGLLGDADSYID